MKTLKKVASIGLMTIAVTQAQAGNLIYQPSTLRLVVTLLWVATY